MRYLFFLIYLLPLASQAEITVVTSIRPIYQITAAIMHDVGEPDLLIKHDHSAHHFAFRPSHFNTLKRADLVIWVDRHFESGFQRLPDLLPDSTEQLELLAALALSGEDGHIWYSPTRLREISDLITAKLIEMDDTNRQVYTKNRTEFQRAILTWQQSMQSLLSENRPLYLLDHDFLQHFHREFTSGAVAVLHDNHDQHGGIKTLQKIEQQLNVRPARCLISNEIDFSRFGNNLANRYNLAKVTLDTFADKGPLRTRFTRHLMHFAEVLRNC